LKIRHFHNSGKSGLNKYSRPHDVLVCVLVVCRETLVTCVPVLDLSSYTDCQYMLCCDVELAKEEQNAVSGQRCGAITPYGIIDEDFEQELGCPSQVVSM